MIKSNESAAGKVIMQLRACLMILSISRDEEFHETRRNLQGDSANIRKKLYRVCNTSDFKKARGYYFKIISSRKCLTLNFEA